jgi:hypothetical protein
VPRCEAVLGGGSRPTLNMIVVTMLVFLDDEDSDAWWLNVYCSVATCVCLDGFCVCIWICDTPCLFCKISGNGK